MRKIRTFSLEIMLNESLDGKGGGAEAGGGGLEFSNR